MMPPRTLDTCQFGPFVLEPGERRLLAGGIAVALPARAFDLLLVLIEHAGHLVTREALFERVWGGVVVEESNLAVQIFALRKALGADTIETVPGRGYRFTRTLEATRAPPSPGTRPDLPRPLTSFVGREGDIATLSELLTRSRLLTLTGVGGAGKTRLAIELAQHVAARFPAGVHFIDLAPLDVPDRVVYEVARAVGVADGGNRPIHESLTRRLASGERLLVFDNCEHLLEACAELAERLLSSCPGLTIVATSREPLGVMGEQLAAVRPLSLPARRMNTWEALASEAVQLFVSRAQLVHPEFLLDAQNVADVCDICERLDGLPLAIELAAGRMHTLSVRQIQERLADRFELLRAAGRTLPRHQTLQAVLRWSYERLAGHEQKLLRQMSVFTGGWTLDAAVAISGPDANAGQVLDLLDSLAAKSFVVVERAHSNRFRMLETVREYVALEMRAAGEERATRDAHLDYYLHRASEVKELIATDLRTALAMVDPDMGNFLAAHTWCNEAHVPREQGLQLISDLRIYWMQRGQFALSWRMFDEALNRPGANAATPARADALFSLGQSLYCARRPAEAKKALLEALDIARTTGAADIFALSLVALAGTELIAGNLDLARRYAEDSVTQAQATGMNFLVAFALNTLGDVHRHEGHFDDALRAFEEGNRLRPPKHFNLHTGHRNIARIAIARGDLEQARNCLIECLHLLKAFDSRFYGQADLEVVAHLASARGEWQLAARIKGAADAEADRMSAFPDAWDDPYLAALRVRPREMLGEATYAEAWKAGYKLDFETAVEEVGAWLRAAGS